MAQGGRPIVLNHSFLKGGGGGVFGWAAAGGQGTQFSSKDHF